MSLGVELAELVLNSEELGLQVLSAVFVLIQLLVQKIHIVRALFDVFHELLLLFLAGRQLLIALLGLLVEVANYLLGLVIKFSDLLIPLAVHYGELSEERGNGGLGLQILLAQVANIHKVVLVQLGSPSSLRRLEEHVR